MDFIAFPGRLWDKKGLDKTQGRQPMPKMHGLVWGASNNISVKSKVICVSEVDGSFIFFVYKTTFLSWQARANA